MKNVEINPYTGRPCDGVVLTLKRDRPLPPGPSLKERLAEIRRRKEITNG